MQPKVTTRRLFNAQTSAHDPLSRSSPVRQVSRAVLLFCLSQAKVPSRRCLFRQPTQPSPAHLARPSSSPAAHLPSSGPERDARPADQPARGGGGAGELPPAPMRPSACGRPQKGTTHYPCLRPRRPIDEPKGRVSAATARKQPVCQCVQAVSRRKEQGRAHTSSGGSNNSKHAVGNAWKARHAHT